jgi:hypothetical protein
MKKLLVVVIIVINIKAFAQRPIEYKEWKINDSKSVVWQKVFDIDSLVSCNDIASQLRAFSWVKDVAINDGVVLATATNYTINYREHGGSSMTMPIIYTSGKWNYSIRIEQKPGKYRVTISSLTFDAGSVSGGFVDVPISGSIEDAVLKKDHSAFKPGQLNYLDIMGNDFQSKFKYKKAQKDEW